MKNNISIKKTLLAMCSSIFLFGAATIGAEAKRDFPFTERYNGPIWHKTLIRPWVRHGSYQSSTLYSKRQNQTKLNNTLKEYLRYWAEEYVIREANNQYRVSMGPWGVTFDWDDSKKEFWKYTTSEGMGYGMLIMALAGDEFLHVGNHQGSTRSIKSQLIFDGMWEFVKANPTNNKTGNAPYLMDWEWGPNDPTGNENNDDSSAFDGDADIAMALYMAHRQWGSNGNINYLNQAKLLIAKIKSRTIGPDSKLPMVGNWVKPNNTSKDCAEGIMFDQHAVRTSDIMLSNFRAFWKITGDSDWNKTYKNTYKAIRDMQKTQNSKALVPDMLRVSTNNSGNYTGSHLNVDSSDPFCDGSESNTNDYSYNASRVPWRLGLDYIMRASNPVSRYQYYAGFRASRIGAFIIKKTKHDANAIDAINATRNIKTGEIIEGADYDDRSFQAPYAVGVSILLSKKWVVTRAHRQVMLNDLWEVISKQHTGENRSYFAETLSLLSMFTITGNFWDPTKDYYTVVCGVDSVWACN